MHFLGTWWEVAVRTRRRLPSTQPYLQDGEEEKSLMRNVLNGSRRGRWCPRSSCWPVRRCLTKTRSSSWWRRDDDPVRATQASYVKLAAAIRCEVSKMYQGQSERAPPPPGLDHRPFPGFSGSFPERTLPQLPPQEGLAAAQLCYKSFFGCSPNRFRKY
jgi:hypothetical protein